MLFRVELNERKIKLMRGYKGSWPISRYYPNVHIEGWTITVIIADIFRMQIRLYNAEITRWLLIRICADYDCHLLYIIPRNWESIVAVSTSRLETATALKYVRISGCIRYTTKKIRRQYDYGQGFGKDVAYFNILSQYLPGLTKKDQEQS